MGPKIRLTVGWIAPHPAKTLFTPRSTIAVQDALDIIRTQAVTGKIGHDLQL